MKRAEQCLESGPAADTDPILLGACRAALRAGEIIASLYDQPHTIRYKGTIDLVTEADLASEKAIIEMLGRDFPAVTVMAEESTSAATACPAGPVWIIDPLDGTTNFAHGFPYFGVSIAYAVNGRTEAGVIYCPVQDELFCAIRGKGAWLNGETIAVSGIDRLQQALVATGFPYDIDNTLSQVIQTLTNVLPRVQDLRRAGAAALDLAYLACGRLDGFWEMDLQPWDTAAGGLLVEEAGGRLSNFSGGGFSPFYPEIVAANRNIHAQLLELLNHTSA